MPGAGPSGRIGRGEDVAVVVDRDAATRGGAGDAGDLHRAAGVCLAPGRGRRRRGSVEVRMLPPALPAAQSRVDDAVDPFEVAGPARGPHFRPGRGAAGRVGRDEDPAFPGDGDAERGGAAGDAAEIERAAELGHLPVARGRVGRGEDLAAVGVVRAAGDRDAEGRRGTGDARSGGWRRAAFVDDRRRPGVGAAGRFGRDVDEAFVADRDAEALRGAGDRLQPAARCRAVRFSFDAGLPGPDG